MSTGLFRSLAAASLAAGLLAAPAFGQGGNYLVQKLTVDAAATKADQERQIIEIVKNAFGPTAVFNTGSGLPQAIDDQIVDGAPLPANAPVSPLPQKIDGQLPQITPGARWVAVGKHLVELGPNNEMHTVIYHALP